MYSSTYLDDIKIYSNFLHREVRISVLLPAGYDATMQYPLLLFNDGQDFGSLRLVEIVGELHSSGLIKPMVVAGIHANERRIYEYGTASKSDYAGRGSEAGQTTSFVTNELLPFLQQHYQVRPSGNAYAGCSLGGLMALDVALHFPALFPLTGVFSGALWWRQKAIGEGYQDSDRIMHAQIRDLGEKPALKCWFQCGSQDEHDDRDGDGVIDSIQDTLECIAALERKGLVWNQDVFYTELPEGRHDQDTWSKMMPEFLKWVSANLE
ncbi:esterase family protein [Dyadobacter sp. Leaf189]|uniref:alpha/beta hydrolase n=1 Tax=Dyadobacter sp. Leaf189 TaxID=1736295 RepID=UPI0006F21DF5|nr:alpha/beta hydrolase-fold protein [Dyadobacter sp. Leaf189]KQS27142.1 esterase [Dyadobacter sp. Leaf189]